MAGKDHAGAPPPYLRGMELSPEQRDKVAVILQKAAAQLDEAERAARDAHHSLAALALSERYNESEAGSLSTAEAGAAARVAALRARVDHEIFLALNPAQQKELAEHLARWRDSHPDGAPDAH